ncbi:MAG TPA: ATP-dependent 6-phosphofructokinase [Ktedonobacterales bacterium]|nr:ATP-dependent 6-phosphofructokinase [Ktedonobacterales bacterium]
MKRIAVVTSGGDAPGMNAALRAVVRTALAEHVEVVGIRDGFIGLVAGRFGALDTHSVAGILQRGGTILGSTRFPQFRERATQEEGIARLRDAGIEGLVVIGGNGSQEGTLALHRLGFPVVGVASTIDNDLAVTETTIGVDTALNTAVSCIDRLKDTATSHQRAFLVEVMGRNSGYLAVMAAIASGAELAIVPERPVDFDVIAEDVRATYARGKRHYIIVVAEGAHPGSRDLANYLSSHPSGFEARLSVLGHVQRGGSPTVRDRVLASQFGAGAVRALLAGHTGVVIGLAKGMLAGIPLEDALVPCNKVTPEMLVLADVLAR